MKNIVKVATLLSLSAATLLASGYRIPEQSLDSVALSAAYIAAANGADASYYNPANMSFMENGALMEAAFTYINLPKITYKDMASSLYSGDSKEEHFFVPTMHYVSPMMGDWRYGLSIVAPAGLSKRWDERFPKATAEEFTLKVIEVNPTASYRVSDQFSLGFGLRGVYTDGIVKSDASGLGSPAKRNLTGDSIDFGYNLALSYKPTKDLVLSSTYRSKVDLTVQGDATLVSGLYKGGASVTIPLPASLALAAAYTMDKTTVELVFERTYWSSYKNLDFNYDVDLTATAMAAFDRHIPKNWKDANAYRIGVSHQYSDALKLMAGFAIDKTPVPSNTLGFELPDSDAKLYSVGFEYKISQNMKMGLAYLYDDKDSRTVTNRSGTNTTAPYGTFTDASAHLVTASLKYKF
ncbi:MAG: porin [Sulfurospirillaceae bacterium]|nr:porin [Sulfurospirillaceae bacterium]